MYIYIGEIVNTHGVKGELRLKSSFKYKDKVFAKDKKIYVGKNKDELVIAGYRVHKDFDMIKFVGIDDINDVLIFKGEKAYALESDIAIREYEYLDESIIGLEVYNNDLIIGKIKDVINMGASDIFVIENEDREILIPNISDYVIMVDVKNQRIVVKDVEGFMV